MAGAASAGSVPTAGWGGWVRACAWHLSLLLLCPPEQVCLGVLIANPTQDQPPGRAVQGAGGPGCGQGCWGDRGAVLVLGGCKKACVLSPVTSCPYQLRRRALGCLSVFCEDIEGCTFSVAACATVSASLDVCAALPLAEPAAGKEVATSLRQSIDMSSPGTRTESWAGDAGGDSCFQHPLRKLFH